MSDMNSKSTAGGFVVRTYDILGMRITTNLEPADIMRRPEKPHYNATTQVNSPAADNPGRVLFKTPDEAIVFCRKALAR